MSVSPMWGARTHVSSVRLVTLAIWAFTLATTPYSSYASFPPHLVAGFGIGQAMFADQSVTRILFTWPMLLAIQGSALIACAVAMLSSRVQALATTLLLVEVVTLDAVSKSLGGYANHAQIIPLLFLAIFACSGGRRYLTVPDFLARQGGNLRVETRRQHGAELRRFYGIAYAVSLAMILPFSYIGIERLTSGGLRLFQGDAFVQYLSAASRSYSIYPVWFNPPAFQLLLNTGFFVTTILEATSGLLLTSRRYRFIWLLGIGLFQVSSLFLMNIFFWESLVLAGALFSPSWCWRSGLGERKRWWR